MTIAATLKSGRFLAPVALALVLAVAFQGCSLVDYDLELVSVTLTPANAVVAGMTTQQFTAIGTYGDDSERDVTAEAAWASSNPEIATVSSGGLATPAQGGTTTITASLHGVSGSATLIVTNALLESIEVTPANPSIANGTRLKFTATGHFDDASTQDLTSQVTWTSSDPSVTIGTAAGSRGLAASTALGAATSTITATFDTISGSTALTVKAVTLASIAVTPATETIRVGASRQFAATGTFSDSSTQDMTGEVAWQSSSTSVAAFGEPDMAVGEALGKAAGTTTITATSTALLGSVPGTAQLTVEAVAPGY
jgi:hypothetical protein